MARHSDYTCVAGCPFAATLDLIGGKWKRLLLFHLLDGTQRFNALRHGLPGVTQRTLTKQLRELEAAGAVSRTVFAEVPPRVEYALTELGRSLQPIVLAMRRWGLDYLERRSAAASGTRQAPDHALRGAGGSRR